MRDRESYEIKNEQPLKGCTLNWKNKREKRLKDCIARVVGKGERTFRGMPKREIPAQRSSSGGGGMFYM